MLKKILMIFLCVMLFSTYAYGGSHKITVTAYTIYKNSSLTASGIDLRKEKNRNFIALNRELSKLYNFGDKFLLEIGSQIIIVEYQDRMKKNVRKKIDFFLQNRKKCVEFGKQSGKLTLLQD